MKDNRGRRYKHSPIECSVCGEEIPYGENFLSMVLYEEYMMAINDQLEPVKCQLISAWHKKCSPFNEFFNKDNQD